MILLLGGSGYIGQAFAKELERRRWDFLSVSRGEVDYGSFPSLEALIRDRKPRLVINAAGFVGRPNVDACEQAQAETLHGNVLFPLNLAHACRLGGIPLGHVSSGCIYTGAKLRIDGRERPQKNLFEAQWIARFLAEPQEFRGYTEDDEPNFSFRHPPCSFYSGSKALAEEALTSSGAQCYVWRLRMPFDEIDGSRNYLSKLQRYPKVYNNVNSLSHRGDFVSACLDLWSTGAPFGIYNVTNPGAVTASQVIALIKDRLRLQREFTYWETEQEFYATAARAPRSNCILETRKLLSTGIQMRPVMEALEHSLDQWIPEAKL